MQKTTRAAGLPGVCCVALAVLLAAIVPAANAQTFYGSIVGTVTDATSASVPGATVTLTNQGTSERRTTETDPRGNYQFVNLVPGVYRVDIEKTGFQRLSRPDIQVQVQAAVRIDGSLVVGEITQTVEILASTPLLQTESTSLSHVVEGRTVQEMPLNGRNVLNLVQLVPGVVPQGSSTGNPMGNQGKGTTTNPNGWGNYQMGGGMANQSGTYMDGAPLNVSYVNSTVLVPTQDAILEFRVATNNVSPEFGRFAGGIVNLTTKSGTNQIHGGAYEYLRNRALNANDFFNNRSNVPRPAFTQNQYGANAGGPVIRDKTFFFFSWEGFKYRQGAPTLTTVPTQAMRNGDFSAAGIPLIYDPLTTTQTSPGVYVRQPFAGNQVPADRIDPTAKVMRDYWGLPTLGGLTNNWAGNGKAGGDQYQLNIRGDQNLGSKQRMFARYTRWIGNTIPNDLFKNKTTGVAAYYSTDQGVVGDSYSITPTMIADIRGSYLRFRFGFTPPSTGASLSMFGPAYEKLAPQMTFTHFPGPNVTGMFAYSQYVIVRNTNNVYALSENVTKILGGHTIKFGGEQRLIEWNYGQTNNASGVFNFDNRITAQNPLSPAGSGYPFASFLLGYPYAGVATEIALSSSRQWYHGLYVTDTWQVSRKLTLNYGVRWDFPGAFWEKHDSALVFLPDRTSSLASKTGLPLKGELALTNTPEYSRRTIHPPYWNLFAPRLGFAYRFNDKTVFRGGYGISYIPSDVAFLNAPWNASVNSAATNMNASLDGGLTPFAVLSNPFPSGLIQPAGHSPTFLTGLLGSSVSAPVADVPYPYVQQWNLTVQRELPGSMAAEVGYAGSKGTHLPISLAAQMNQLPDQYISQGAALLTTVNNPFYGILPASVGTLAAAKVTQGQLYRPYPHYLSVTNASAMRGGSTYHSLQTKLEKRFKSGGNLLATYTWSKLISDSDTLTSWLESSAAGGVQNWNNLRGEKSLASYDVPHRLMLSYVLDLPIGKGKTFFRDVQGIADKLASGWGINGVTTFQAGYPLVLTAQATTLSSTFGAGTPRPVVVAGCQKEISGPAQSRLGKWFETSCFSQPGSFAYGTESRTDPDLRSPGINNWDLAIFKNTRLSEQVNLRFQAEVFNLANRVQFNAPGASLGTSTFGIVSAARNLPRQFQFGLRLTF
jgi:hypothetical protein